MDAITFMEMYLKRVNYLYLNVLFVTVHEQIRHNALEPLPQL